MWISKMCKNNFKNVFFKSILFNSDIKSVFNQFELDFNM